MTYQIHSTIHPFNADLHTPVELYLSLRNRYRKSCLLESNDYHSRQESRSFIGIEPIVEIQLSDYDLQCKTDEQTIHKKLHQEIPVSVQIQDFLKAYDFVGEGSEYIGFFGRFGFEYALLNEQHITKPNSALELPDVHLFIFKYVLVIDHFKDEGLLVKSGFEPEQITDSEINAILGKNNFSSFPFQKVGKETSALTETEFKELTKKALGHVQRGDVFQLVLSNSYQQAFFGDDFSIYRSLRRLNPSPFLFYFDFESYHLFGSSPEAQLKIENGVAEIHPIAGTEMRTGDADEDQLRVDKLLSDEKENAEHTMLVDLARNDLSIACNEVRIDKYKEIQAFSHVFHMVSVVKGQLSNSEAGLETFSHTFPAGTLSGTPKPKALELIAAYEPNSRDFYGGSVGLLNANGDINMAIVIRSVLSKNGVLNYRAGAGIVLDSNPDNEFQEVQNKLGAVRKAIEAAENMYPIHTQIA